MRIRVLVQRAVHWTGVLWAQFGILILCLLILNALAGIVVRTAGHLRKRTHPVREEAYARAPWAYAYYKSLNRVNMRWFPYIYWKAQPLSSEYLNIGPDGDRLTWNRPARREGRPLLRIFAFGGSTMWGYAARDDHTPASLLARKLASATDYNIEVHNYAQIGYVSTQEVLELYELLSQGERPDVVIFYDGINDCAAAYQSGVAGLSHNEFIRAREFNLLGSRLRRRNLYMAALRTLLLNSNTARLGRLIGGKDTDADLNNDAQARHTLSYLHPLAYPADAAVLEQEVVDRYLFNERVVKMLGAQFGFRSLFYWQPVIFFKDKLTPFERNFVGERRREDFFAGVYKRMAAAAPAGGVRDISGIFKDRTETVFTDTWHPTEQGDAMIADVMAADVAKVLSEMAGRGASGGLKRPSQ